MEGEDSKDATKTLGDVTNNNSPIHPHWHVCAVLFLLSMKGLC